jgi:hypothetical protein
MTSSVFPSTAPLSFPHVDLAATLLRLRPGGRSSEQDERPLGTCPQCCSPLVQPQGWRELPDGAIVLHLRCPECMVRLTGNFDHERIAEYDDALVKGREAIVADYEAIVRHNMQELSRSFARALELDLIGADDFVSRIDSRHDKQ